MEKKKISNLFPAIAILAYSIGVFLLLVAPIKPNLSPGSNAPIIFSSPFVAMTLLAITSIMLIGTVVQKGKLSKETKKYIEKNLEKDVEEITEDVIVTGEQSRRDLSKFVYIIGIAGLILAIFQAVKIFTAQTAAGVSMIYWGAYLIIAAAWFGYGIYSKNKPIIVTYAMWVLVEILIINGIYFYS
ncbi:MAG: hypothetical protein ABIH92_05900 [Nanoarchaeota archaeon]